MCVYACVRVCLRAFLYFFLQATDGEEDTESLMLQQLKELIKKNFDAKKVSLLKPSQVPASPSPTILKLAYSTLDSIISGE